MSEPRIDSPRPAAAAAGPGATGPAAPEAAVLRRMRTRALAARFGVLALLALALVVFSLLEPSRFLTGDTFATIVRQAAVGAVVALGVTVVLVLYEFDLSIAGVMGLSGGLAVHLMLAEGLAWPLAALVAVAAGALVGLLNGMFVAYVGASSFVATLATGSVATAMEFQFTGEVQISEGIPKAFTDLGTTKVAGLELSTVLALAVAALLWVLLERTELGRRLRAVGGNRETARFSGVRVRELRLTAFAIVGVCAGVTGVVLAAESAAYAPNAGASLLIPTYAAVFIGAAVLRPGVFTILGTVVGLVFLSVVSTGLTIVGVAGWAGEVISGAILMTAILLSRLGGEHG